MLEQPQTELCILGNAPLRPAAGCYQCLPLHESHRAVLNDGVALVARDHADQEEATVLGVTHRLEHALAAVAIVLRRLHDRDLRLAQSPHESSQPQSSAL